MILENYSNASSFYEGSYYEQSGDFIGDHCELLEMSVNYMTDVSNLSMAMARLEHRCIVENDTSLMEGGVYEFFESMKNKVVEWFTRFVNFMRELGRKIKDVFVKRAGWLSRNIENIKKATAEQLKGHKIKIGANLIANAGKLGAAATSTVDHVHSMISAVPREVSTAESGKTFMEKAKGFFTRPFKTRDANKSTAAAIHAEFIGDEQELELSPGLISGLISVAQNTFKSMEKFPSVQGVADAAIKLASAEAKMIDGDKTAISARISALQQLGSQCQVLVSAYSSAVSAANAQAMPPLVKAASLGGKKKADAAAPATAANEGGSLLAAFM